MAISGSTKIDELNYHMLLPSRIVADYALIFYRDPWPAAIWPQMLYQIALVPLHAAGLSHAGNVVSLLLYFQLLLLCYSLITSAKHLPNFALFLVVIMCAGIYPLVWMVTSGAHAFGELAVTAAVLVATMGRRLSTELGLTRYCSLFAILIVAFISTKVSLLPLGGVFILVAAVTVWQISTSGSEFTRAAATFALPFVVFYLPLVIFTFVKTGSPFGPVMAGVFGHSGYDTAEISAELTASSNINRSEFWQSIYYNLRFNYSPVFWGLVLGYLFISGMPRVVPLCALVLQLLLIVFVLPYDLRFLGGVQLAIVTLFGIFATTKVHRLFDRRVVQAAIVICILPWIAGQTYYVWPFAKFITGRVSAEEHYKTYIAFYDDYLQLDQLLPTDSALLVGGVRLNSFYAPRPLSAEFSDIQRFSRKYFFSVRNSALDSELSSKGWSIGQLIYENSNALSEASRVPWKSGGRSELKVFELIPPGT